MNYTCFFCEEDVPVLPESPEPHPKLQIKWGHSLPDQIVDVCPWCLADWLEIGTLVRVGHLGETWVN